MIPASIAGRGNPFTRTVSAKVAIVLLQDDRFGAPIRRGALAGHTRLQRTVCSAFDIATLLRPPIIRVVFGGDVRVAKLPVGRRQTGNNHANISNRSCCCCGQNRQECLSPSKATSVRAARCCGSGLDDCGFVAIAEGFLGRVWTEATGGALTLVGRFGVR
jgi:hypothetical protein